MKIKLLGYIFTIADEEDNKNIEQVVDNNDDDSISSSTTDTTTTNINNRDSINVDGETTTSDTTTTTTTSSDTTTATTSTTDKDTPTKSSSKKEDKNLKKRLETEAKQKLKEEKEQKIKDEKERIETEKRLEIEAKQKQKEEKEQKLKDEKERIELEKRLEIEAKQKQKEEKEQKIKEEKERVELEKQSKLKEKEEKERLKKENKLTGSSSNLSNLTNNNNNTTPDIIIDKEVSKDTTTTPSTSSTSTPTSPAPKDTSKPTSITREPSVISKIFSVKKSNSNSLIIERSPSPIQDTLNVPSSPQRKSNNEIDIDQVDSEGSGDNNTEGNKNKPIEKSLSTNELKVEDSTDPAATPIINDKEELSSISTISSPTTKREVVIKVTRAFAPVVHVNVMKEEGENKMRNMVINEIINTERDYIADLTVIINFIYTPLKEMKILNDKDLSTIFSNIQLLLSVNKELLVDLELKAPMNEPGQSVGSCFIYFFKYLKIYSSYCANQTISADHIACCSKKVPAFKQFLEEKQAAVECRQNNLESFLIKPVQRLCKYPLLLRELIKNSVPGHFDQANLETAFNEIQTVVLSVNESKRKAEIHQKMYKIHQKLDAPEKFVFFTPTRYLIREATFGELTEEKDKISGRMHYYLFNDIIMRTAKDKKSIKLETLFIIASTNVDGEENRNSSFCNTFEISQPGTTGRRFTLVADSYEQKMEWYTDLDELIRPHREEYSRNADKVLDHIKRSTIATASPSNNNNESPKALHRTTTASGALQQSTLNNNNKPIHQHAIPSKPLPPPPPKSKQSTITPPTAQIVVTPDVEVEVSTPTPSTTPIAQVKENISPPIVKPRPVSTAPVVIKKSFVTNSNAQPSTDQSSPSSGPPIPSRTVRPISVSPITTNVEHELSNVSTTRPKTTTVTSPINGIVDNNQQAPTTPQQPTTQPISKASGRPLPNPSNTTTTTTTPPTTTSTNTIPKPISFPSKLSNLKQAAPNTSVRSASTFVPSVKNNISSNNNIATTKDDLSLPSSVTTNNNSNITTPPGTKPRVMPLPPRGPPNSSTTTTTTTPPQSPNTINPPTIEIKKPITAPVIPPRK